MLSFGLGDSFSTDILDLKKKKKFKPIGFSWAWMAKYREQYRPSDSSFDGIYYTDLTHTGFYSPTGAGKTFLRNTVIEVSLWAHDTNIVISDRKLDSLGFLLPQDTGNMLNAQFFPNPRTGRMPIIPDRLPPDKFHLWLPATKFSYIDPVIHELVKWGVVKWFRFHPRIFIDTTMGDYLPYAVGMTQTESLSTSRALMNARGEVKSEQERENWSFSKLEEYINKQREEKEITHMSKPYKKLIILDDSGVISTDTSVELIDRNTHEHIHQKVHIFRDFKEIIKPKGKFTDLHVFCNKYMSSASVDSTLSTCINYLIFGMIREECENVHKKRRVLVHLPEAEYSLGRSSGENQNSQIRRYFATAYANALRETRQYQMYNFLDTQQVSELPSNITGNQLTLWLLPGFKHKGELNWLKAGLGRAQIDEWAMQDLLSMSNPFDSRGFAFYIGQNKAVKVWTRPRQTYHFQEGDDPVQLLKNYRVKWGLDSAQSWRRWDE